MQELPSTIISYSLPLVVVIKFSLLKAAPIILSAISENKNDQIWNLSDSNEAILNMISMKEHVHVAYMYCNWYLHNLLYIKWALDYLVD